MRSEYIFNECGVCMDTDNFGVVECSTGMLTRQYISTARKPNGMWVYGLHYGYDHEGACVHPATLRGDEYPTQRDAVLAACRYILSIADEQDRTHRHKYSTSFDGEHFKTDTCCNMRKCAELAYNQVNQLTLFDL